MSMIGKKLKLGNAKKEILEHNSHRPNHILDFIRIW